MSQTATSSKLYYFREAYPEVKRINDKFFVVPSGDTGKSESVVVEDFVPRDHYDKYGNLIYELQKAEFLGCKKAYKLSYFVPGEREFFRR